ncbi:hypothetical protein HanIR_Chr02g0070771 [Helianthus annuus]|nr:hypothetical protein HanIR_Chr02g0070771 [Helianthus annuus]
MLVQSPLLLNYFVHYDTLWCRYKLVAWANHDRAFHAKHGDACSVTAIVELFHSLRHLVVSV